MVVCKDKLRLGITVENEVFKQIKDLAEKEKRSISAMSAILIEEALDKRNVNKHAYIRGVEYYGNLGNHKNEY